MRKAINSQMQLVAALKVLLSLRTDQIVVSSMGTAREWPRISRHPLDLHYVPSAMGQAVTLGLGLALAQPQREVIALTGDGSLLMNLGSLITVAANRAENLTVILFDNGVYEVTGGQMTAAEAARQSGHPINWLAMADAAGIESAISFDDIEAWKGQARDALMLPGPRLVVLKVATVAGDHHLESPGPIAARLARFRAELGT